MSLLSEWEWSLFSVVYTDGGAEGDVAKHLLRGAGHADMKAAVKEPVPLQVR